MVYSLSYRRPSKASEDPDYRDSLSGDEKQKSINESISSGSSRMSHGIPEALSFDRIISGGTCPPCTVRDFMNYLKYVAFSAENLQFYLWFKGYVARFDQLPQSEKALSPGWTKHQAEAEANNANRMSKNIPPTVSEMLKDTDFAEGQPRATHNRADPFVTPDKTPSLEEKRELASEYASSADEQTQSSMDHRSAADHAFDEAGLKWKPFTAQPYRDEINRIIGIYIAEGSTRELNLSGRERTAVLHALQNTTHPSALQPIFSSIEYTLRLSSHPNFIRWTICNGNRPRVIFARGLGVAGILGGFLADLLITLSHASRPWRVLPFLGWFIGIATLVAAWKGMCVVLHGMHHRHLRPWELFREEPEEDEKHMSQESFTSTSTNSFEDEPWVVKYQKRNIIRKIFDRELWIKEPALRQIQDTIFLQAILGAFVASCIFVGIFCAVPGGKFY